MQEKVEAYLKKSAEKAEQARQKENQKLQEKELRYRTEVQRMTGLVKREYNSTGKQTDKYPLYDAAKDVYYRIVPLELTDEEWEAVRTAYEQEQAEERPKPEEKEWSGRNGVASALKAIAIILYIGAVIGAIAVGAVTNTALPAVYVLCGGILSGIFVHGFSEIIRLLDCISRNTEKK